MEKDEVVAILEMIYVDGIEAELPLEEYDFSEALNKLNTLYAKKYEALQLSEEEIADIVYKTINENKGFVGMGMSNYIASAIFTAQQQKMSGKEGKNANSNE